ncbi:hypothetical protein ACSDQ9_04320 [Aestuariimicrobium soli]|uniref:hypothetical protein n=1 Tax=Aestuariimicrobium soli TaxID=2035834 RepID=UPI003EB818D3
MLDILVGSSRTAGGVAVARRWAATGSASVVVDLDLGSGGLDVTAGVEHLVGRRWSDLAELRGAVPVGTLTGSLPHEHGCHVLSAGGPGPPDVPAAAVQDGRAALTGSVHPVVLDVPRSSPYLATALTSATTVVVLAGLTTRALADADALVERLVDAVESVEHPVDLRLVTRGPRPGAAVLDDVEAHLGVAHLHHLLDDPAVGRTAERCLWPGSGRDAVRRCADVVLEAMLARSVGRAS